MIKSLIRNAEKLLSHSRFGINFYVKLYETILDNEIKMASINANDCVLNIGGGAIPFSAILIARKTGANVVVVDRDLKAIKRAKKVVSKLDLTHRIALRHQDGTASVAGPVTVVLLALQTNPLSPIIAHHRRDHPEARFVARIAKTRYRNHYDTLPKNIVYKRQVKQDMKAFNASVMF